MSSTRETDPFDAWLRKVENLPEPQRTAVLREAKASAVRRRSLQTAQGPAELALSVDSDYVITPAIEMISESLEWALNTERARLMITMPPQEGKTELTAVWTVLRALQKNPDARIILASYSQDLAEVAATRARNMIAQHGTGARDPLTGLEEQDRLGLELAHDKAAAAHWRIRGQKGGVVAVGLNGTITGRPADLIIIDDPIKGMATADSKAERAKIIQNYRGDLTTRLSATAPVILIQTRWHEQDLAGFILQQEESRPAERRRWRRVNIPALSIEGIPDALDRAPGVWMKSARGRTPDVWEEIREDVGERVFFALYEGDPTPPSGGLFKVSWFDRYRMTATGPTTRRLVSVDPAETGKNDEAAVIGVAANRQGKVMWTHDWSGLMTSDQWMRKAVLLALLTKAEEITFEAYTTEQTYARGFRDTWTDIRLQARLLRRHHGDIESAAADLALDERAPADPVASLSELVGVDVPDQQRPPFRIHGYRGTGDKIARAGGSRRAVETGRLSVVGNLSGLENQATQWQVGQGSPDRVDAAVNGYERMRELMGRRSSVSSPVGTLADAGDLLSRDIG